MTCSTSRSEEICRAADELLRRIGAWIRERPSGPIPASVQNALKSAVAICDQSEVPEPCRALGTVAIGRLAEEFRGYTLKEPGKVRHESGGPGPSFWAALAEFARTRHATVPPQFERLEPVAELLAQGVSPAQIARHIYGRRGQGPFLLTNGEINTRLIEQEAALPGSVVGPDWTPPWRTEVLKRRKHQLDRQLKLFSSIETARADDVPNTVEQLLQQGAFVQQIERVKGVSRDEIQATAERIGVPAIDRPGYKPPVLDPASQELLDDDEGSGQHRESIKSLIIQLFQESNERRTAADIVAELRQLGHDVHTPSVAATIGHWKRNRRMKSVG